MVIDHWLLNVAPSMLDANYGIFRNGLKTPEEKAEEKRCDSNTAVKKKGYICLLC
ncbi:hypothetical protein ACTQ1O_04035 [Bilifractor sp. LCP21S3_A7]|uniref:hypothetical protein n=1 Tax=Bilifractor sp. LCP21S3_A7 TaxID=3438738 RepID=UPI003F905B9A